MTSDKTGDLGETRQRWAGGGVCITAACFTNAETATDDSLTMKVCHCAIRQM